MNTTFQHPRRRSPAAHGLAHAVAAQASLERRAHPMRLQAASGATQRAAWQRYIHACFWEQHRADIRHFMPQLMGLVDAQGELHGVVGYRLADHEPLFLERYLDAPIEVEMARHLGLPVQRSGLVEVGNLAATDPGMARRLIVALTHWLGAQGHRWVAFTATDQLINSFHRLGLRPLHLARADPARLGAEEAQWGDYYRHRPQLVVGDIAVGQDRLSQAVDGLNTPAPDTQPGTTATATHTGFAHAPHH